MSTPAGIRTCDGRMRSCARRSRPSGAGYAFALLVGGICPLRIRLVSGGFGGRHSLDLREWRVQVRSDERRTHLEELPRRSPLGSLHRPCPRTARRSCEIRTTNSRSGGRPLPSRAQRGVHGTRRRMVLAVERGTDRRRRARQRHGARRPDVFAALDSRLRVHGPPDASRSRSQSRRPRRLIAASRC